VSRPVYSERFVAVSGLTSIVSYTVPAGYRMVLRDIDIFQGSQPTAPDFRCRGAGGATIFQITGGVLTDTWSAWRGRQVFYEGERVDFIANVGNCDVTASGYLLTLP
jgi:hypothetical protein